MCIRDSTKVASGVQRHLDTGQAGTGEHVSRLQQALPLAPGPVGLRGGCAGRFGLGRSPQGGERKTRIGAPFVANQGWQFPHHTVGLEPRRQVASQHAGRHEGAGIANEAGADGREVGIDFVEERDFFGELAVIDSQPAPEYVIAVAPSRVAMLDRERARRLMFSSPETSEVVAQRLAQRMRRSARQRAVLALPSSFQRVCAQLIILTQARRGGAPTITLPPTHQEIAIMVNTSRETVTRALQFLQGIKVVVRSGQDLIVNQPDALKDAADGKIAPGK